MLNRVAEIVYKDYREVPASIKFACWNLAIFTFGWGLGTDTFLSIFMEDLLGSFFLIGLLTASLAAVKLVLNLPIGDIDGRVDQRKFMIAGKLLYVAGSIFAFLAGYFSSAWFLIGFLFCFGIASPMVYTTYQCYIRERSSAKNSSKVFGLYNASMAVSYTGAALLSALIVPYMELHWFYMFPIFLAIYSIRGDRKLIRQHKNPILKEIKKSVFKENIYKKVWKDLKAYDYHLRFILIIHFLWGLLDYVSFFFIPLLALTNNLSLPQIAVLFALSRMPFMLCFFFAEIADRRERLSLIGASLIIASLLLAILASASSFSIIVLASVALSLCLAIIRPAADGVLTNLIMPRQRSEITGVQEFVSKSGQIAGALIFGVFSEIFSIGWAFVGIAVIFFLAGLLTLVMRRYHARIGLLELINVPLGIFHFHPKFSKAKWRVRK